jgi:hypothetical protein
MAAKQQEVDESGNTYPRPLANRPDFADQRIADQFTLTEYSWEHLPTSAKHHVRQMVRRSQGQRRARLVAVFFALLLLLAIIAGVALYVFAGHLPFISK